MDEASFLDASFLTASFLLQGTRAILARLSSSQLQTPHMTALECLHCGSSRWSWHHWLIITCRHSVQITLPFFWHLAFIRYYNTPVSLCGFSCGVSAVYLSVAFLLQKNDCITYQDKAFKRLLGENVSAKFSPYCPSHSIPWHRNYIWVWITGGRKVLPAVDRPVLPSCPHFRTLQSHCHLWLVFCYLKAT